MSRNFGCKREEPIFQVWGGAKKGGGEPKFFPNRRGGIKVLHTMIKSSEKTKK